MEENMLMNQAEYVPGPDSEYQPISTWGYVGIILLMGIPVVGLILTVVWACGGCKKKNKTNFARASLILGAVGLILAILIGFAVKSVVSGVIEKMERFSTINVENILGEDVAIPENLEELSELENIEELDDLESIIGSENMDSLESMIDMDSLEDLQNLDEADIMGIINELDEEELESIAQMLESLGQSIE